MSSDLGRWYMCACVGRECKMAWQSGKKGVLSFTLLSELKAEMGLKKKRKRTKWHGAVSQLSIFTPNRNR